MNPKGKFICISKIGIPVCPEHELCTTRLYDMAYWNQWEDEGNPHWLVDIGTKCSFSISISMWCNA